MTVVLPTTSASTAAPHTVAPIAAPVPSVLDDIAQRTMAALNPITGNYDERLRAFKDIAANTAASQIGINGWQSMSQILTACWLADGLQVHPTVFMRGNWLFNVYGRNVVEPRWQFIVGLMRARIPGFRMKVIEKSEDRAVVWMANGVDEHTEEYTRDDAERQGLWDKKGGTYQTNPKELLFKQAVKRAGDIIGGHVLMGLPDRDDDQPIAPEPTPAANPAAALAAALPAAPAESVNQVKRLGQMLTRIYGLPAKATKARLEKVSFLLTEIRKSPVEITTPEHLGPSDAKELADFLEAKFGATGTEKAVGAASSDANPAKDAAEPGASNSAPNGAESGGGAKEGSEGMDAPADPKKVLCGFPGCEAEATLIRPSSGAWCDDHGPAEPAADEAPPPIGEEAPPPAEDDLARQGLAYMDEQDGKVATLVMLGTVAEKSHPTRRFLMESPKGSKKLWFVDQKILGELGQENSIKVLDGGAQTVAPDLCRALARAMRAAGVAAPGAAMPRHTNRRG